VNNKIYNYYMRLSAESANLEFDSLPVLFSAGTSYNVGFNGDVNWRTVLGDMYNKYDYFYIGVFKQC